MIFGAALALAGCCNIGEPLADNSGTVNLSTRVKLESLTKAAPFTAVPDFSMYGYTYTGGTVGAVNYCINEKMILADGAYKSANRYPKVVPGTNILLVGIAPYDDGGWSGPAADATGDPKITYTMPAEVADQKDVIVGSYSTGAGFDGNCDMTFSHILSGVRFSFSTDGAFDGSIKSIALKGIFTKGTYTLGSGWSGANTPGSTSQTLNKAVTTSSTGAITEDAGTFIVLPQSLPDSALIEVVANDGSGDRTLVASLKGKVFEVGKMYTYNLNLSSLAGGELFIESIDLSAWEYDAGQYGASKVMTYSGTIPGGTFEFPQMSFSSGTSMIVDWGDGSDLERRSGVSGKTILSHEYASSGNRTIKVYAIGGTFALTVDEEEAGAYSVLNDRICLLKIKYFDDLSKIDFLTGKEMSQSTANCYVINKAGKYGFPLVYGNGITGGNVNAAAYTNGATEVTRPFCDDAGNAITSPYILTQKGISESQVTAEMLWQTKDGMISDLSVKDGYVRFRVNDVEGNALVAVKRGGTILWSWHIWATGQAIGKDSEGFMNQVLGVTSNDPYGSHYQWGRKDPFFDGTMSAVTGPTDWPNMAGTITNPTMPGISFNGHTGSSENDEFYWTVCNVPYRNSWDADNMTLNADSRVAKTIYDPCPAGFTVPRLKACRNLPTLSEYVSALSGGTVDEETEAKWEAAMLKYGSLFPLYGTWSGSVSMSEDVGELGLYWNSTPVSITLGGSVDYAGGCIMHEKLSDIDMAMGYVAPVWNAASIRPAAENFREPHEVDVSSCTDLSKVNFLTGASMTQETANCYVVRSSGDYKFPLVYGNGIKGGSTNSTAYKNGATYTGTKNTFKDNSGSTITSPYILTQKKLSESNVTAEVLWQTGDVVSNLKVQDGYICFSVEEADGNAVIAIKSGSTVLWSWHVWATSLSLSETSDGILSHNVGATANDPAGCYYQWGRKDPFVSGMTASKSSVTMANTIANPTTFYCSSEGVPYSVTYYNNWDQDCRNTTDQKVTKTIYDPCPAGFTVPRLSVFSSCTKANAGTGAFPVWHGATFYFTGGLYPSFLLGSTENPTLISSGSISSTKTGMSWISNPNMLFEYTVYSGEMEVSTLQTAEAGAMALPIRPYKVE